MLGTIIAGIGTALAGIGAAISTAVSTIGPAIATFAAKVVAKLPAVLETAKNVVSIISGVVSTVASVKGIIEQDERVDEIGAKMMQPGTRAKRPEETTEEYLNYLRNDVELDRAKFEEMKEAEKVASQVIGTSLVTKAIEEKSGVEITPDSLITIHKAKLGAAIVDKLIDSFAENKIKSLDKLTEYINNTLDENEVGKVGGAIKEAIISTEPELSQADISKEVTSMKTNYFASDKEYNAVKAN